MPRYRVDWSTEVDADDRAHAIARAVEEFRVANPPMVITDLATGETEQRFHIPDDPGIDGLLSPDQLREFLGIGAVHHYGDPVQDALRLRKAGQYGTPADEPDRKPRIDWRVVAWIAAVLACLVLFGGRP